MFLKGKLVDRWRASTANGRLPSNQAFKIFGKATWEKRKFPFFMFWRWQNKTNKKKNNVNGQQISMSTAPTIFTTPQKMLIGHVKVQSAKNNLQWEIFKIVSTIQQASSPRSRSLLWFILCCYITFDLAMTFAFVFMILQLMSPKIPISFLFIGWNFLFSFLHHNVRVPDMFHPVVKHGSDTFFFLNAPLDTSDTPFYIFAAVDVTSFQYDNSNSKK